MNRMKGRNYLIVLHAVGWVVFITLPVLVLPKPKFMPENVSSTTLLFFLTLSSLPLMGLFYAHLNYALPNYYLRKRYGHYALFLLLGLGVMLAIPELMYRAFEWIRAVFEFQASFMRRGTVYRSVVVLIVSFALFAYQRWRLAESQRAEAELSYLKAQINPHFLFNTLNSIYYLALQQSERTPMAVEKLSAIMRYVINEANQEWVPLAHEINYLSDYIALQRLRFADNVHVDFQVTGDLAGKRIAPLLMVSFVENAFKHGISMEEESPITIVVNVGSESLRFTVRNRILGGYAGMAENSGIGLENTRRRLELAYPGRHRLEMGETEGEFEVRLEIGNA